MTLYFPEVDMAGGPGMVLSFCLSPDGSPTRQTPQSEVRHIGVLPGLGRGGGVQRGGKVKVHDQTHAYSEYLCSLLAKSARIAEIPLK